MTSVDVHSVHLDVSALEEVRCRKLLSEQEISRADRFRFPEIRTRFVVSHGALRKFLSGYLDVSPENLRLNATDRGKPFLDPLQNGRNLQFSLSHSRNLAVIAICRDNPIGIDVEYNDPDRSLSELAGRYFSPGEAACLLRFEEDERVAVFYRIWTLKESWLKATGMGLEDLCRIETAVKPDGRIEIIRWGTHGLNPMESTDFGIWGKPLDFRQFEPWPGFTASYTRLYSSQTVSMM